MKRLFDIFVSALGSLLFLPFGLLIARCLRFTGGGGRGGEDTVGDGELYVRRHRLIPVLLCAVMPLLEGLWGGAARAQLPTEVVLLVNSASEGSKRIANHYAILRGIPPERMVHLDLPGYENGGEQTISRREFTKQIWKPAWKELSRRGIDEEDVLAWLYSADFPTRVVSEEDLSLTGITLVRNRLPPAEAIRDAGWISPFFGGPVGPTEDPPPRPPCSLEFLAEELPDPMPLPAMMLGVLGPHGNTVEEVLACLERGRRSDGRRPEGRVVFERTGDRARSSPREWQYPLAVEELERLGVSADIVERSSPDLEGVMGMLTGRAALNPNTLPSFAPGAMGEHLTSYAGRLDGGGQTKLSAWIRAGATASSGTVTEPRNYWMKFPHARFFVYYASGCTMLESFYQSLASPLQQILVGEPLARPWRVPLEIRVREVPPRPPLIHTRFSASWQPMPTGVTSRFRFYLDGIPLPSEGGTTGIELDPATLEDGYHELTVVGWVERTVRHAAIVRKGFHIRNQGRGVVVAGLEALEEGEVSVRVEVEGREPPRRLYLMHQGRELDRVRHGKERKLAFTERTLGEGPHRIQVVAEYRDGSRAASSPYSFGITYEGDE